MEARAWHTLCASRAQLDLTWLASVPCLLYWRARDPPPAVALVLMAQLSCSRPRLLLPPSLPPSHTSPRLPALCERAPCPTASLSMLMLARRSLPCAHVRARSGAALFAHTMSSQLACLCWQVVALLISEYQHNGAQRYHSMRASRTASSFFLPSHGPEF